jgi:hypothetical protein
MPRKRRNKIHILSHRRLEHSRSGVSGSLFPIHRTLGRHQTGNWRKAMGDATIWLGPLLGGLLLYGLIHLLVRSGGYSLQGKFRRMGNMTGMSKAAIIAAVGNPNSVSGLPEGKQLLQWMAPGYHICIRFTQDGTFDGITHEVAV